MEPEMKEPTEAMRAAWKASLAEAPENIRKVAERFDPYARYRMADTGQIVRLDNFSENGTVQVYTDPKFNPPGPRTGMGVFGVDPNNLKPWPPLA
jgi:hypothetical protein